MINGGEATILTTVADEGQLVTGRRAATGCGAAMYGTGKGGNIDHPTAAAAGMKATVGWACGGGYGGGFQPVGAAAAAA